METLPDKPTPRLPIVNLLPNLVTLIAIAAGLTAIRFGLEGNYERAVKLILLAAVLDGLDGKLARLLNSDSKMGAELDSLADFINFGVAPPLVMYFWGLQEARSLGWIAVLVFTIACVLRLARFNVDNKSDDATEENHGYFTGVPTPAGALLVMMPMFLTFAFADEPFLPAGVISFYMMVIGLLMISNIRTWSFKALKISRNDVKFLMIGLIMLGAAVLTYAWITLFAIGLAYVGIVIWCLATKRAP